MRTRYIKPGLLTNEVLGKRLIQIRYLFAILPMAADREGRLEDRPDRIRVELLPYDKDADVDAWLQALHEDGFIERYDVGGERYIQITKFSKHQHPHHREATSVIPPSGVKKTESPGLGRTKVGPRPHLGTAEPGGEWGMGNGEWGMGNGERSDPQAPWNPEAGWKEFEVLYPVRVGLENGCRAYFGRINTQEEHVKLVAGTKRYLESAKWRDREGELLLGFIPAMDRFISQGLYIDYPPPAKTRASRAGRDEEALRLLREKEQAAGP